MKDLIRQIEALELPPDEIIPKLYEEAKIAERNFRSRPSGQIVMAGDNPDYWLIVATWNACRTVILAEIERLGRERNGIK